ncbi:MAG: PRC-barrel domain-containing protein [Sulfitobacter sp.]
MKRFLSTTAVLLTMTGAAAYAETHAADASGFGSVTVQQGDFYASDLIGMRIHNAEAPVEADARVAADASAEWDDIGEINDLIVNNEGDVTAVILGVGGFLGMGEHDVTVSMDQIQSVYTEDGDRFLVVSTTKEALEAAPEFDRAALDADMNAGMDTSDTAAVTDTQMGADATHADANANVDADANADVAEADVNADANADPVRAGEVAEAQERDMLVAPQLEREGYETAAAGDVEQLTAEDLDGSYVYGANDETVGEIDRLIMSDDGKVEHVVINVGGFLGLGEKPVAVTFDELQVMKNVEGDDFRIYIDSTEEALEAQPEYQE